MISPIEKLPVISATGHYLYGLSSDIGHGPLVDDDEWGCDGVEEIDAGEETCVAVA